MIISLHVGPLAGWTIDTGSLTENMLNRSGHIRVPLRPAPNQTPYYPLTWAYANPPGPDARSACYYRKRLTMPCACGNHPEGHMREVWTFEHYTAIEQVHLVVERLSRRMALP